MSARASVSGSPSALASLSQVRSSLSSSKSVGEQLPKFSGLAQECIGASREEMRETITSLCDASLYDVAVLLLPLLIDTGEDITVGDINSMGRVQKGTMDQYRNAWRSLYVTEQKERGRGREDRSTALQQSRREIEGRIIELSRSVVEVARGLIGRAPDPVNRGLLWKMVGDFYRYLAEVQRGYDRRDSAARASQAYQEAEDLIVPNTPPGAAARLALQLNLAVFKFEILTEPDEAIAIARKAFEEGNANVDVLRDDAYADSMLVLMIIRRTIAAWMSGT